MEASLIRDRVIAGLHAAKEKGTPLGRPPLISQKKKAILLYQQNFSVQEISNKSGLGISTVYKLIREHKNQL